MNHRRRQKGFNLVELTTSLVIAALLLTGVQRIFSTGMEARDVVTEQIELNRHARFAMNRMVGAVRNTGRLLVPLSNNPATPYDENLREQTVPASPPQTGSTLATAVLAVTLSRSVDADGDGSFDADNDDDGRFDEDLPADTQNDGKAGIRDIDDDGNGTKDFFLSPSGDDDESNDLAQSEDPFDGADNDGDGSIDEDPGADNNGDTAPGVAGVDDDGDGNIDEGDVDDDDEDGQTDEDWYDPVVFYLLGDALVERRSVPWDTNADSTVNGRDFVESVIAENVTLIRFERLSSNANKTMVDVTLTLTAASAVSVTLNTRVRVGGDSI